MSETLTSTTTMLTTTTLPDACHPASSTLELKDGRVIPISHLRIGDRIRTPSGWEEVVVLGHAETVKASPSNLFVRITAGEYSAAFSSNHYIFVDGVEKAGGDVRVGEKIMTVAGERVIERVEHIMEAGLYDFFVPSGTYYIDGVMMSTYHDNLGIPLLVWDYYPLGYCVLRYRLGFPVVGDGQGLFSCQWPVYTLLAMGVPGEWVQMLRVLTCPIIMVSEVINSVLTLALTKLGLGGVVL